MVRPSLVWHSKHAKPPVVRGATLQLLTSHSHASASITLYRSSSLIIKVADGVGAIAEDMYMVPNLRFATFPWH